MADITTLPEFVTRNPWEGPPVPPFQWRAVDTGPVKFEFLFDARGRQIFDRSSAIIRKVGTTTILWPESETAEGEGRADG